MKSRAGFTLVELLMVIAIIGTLATIALPEFQRYRARAFNVTAESDLTQFRNSVINVENPVATGVLTQTGPATHAALSDVTISKDVTVRSEIRLLGGSWIFVSMGCHVIGDTGYMLYVPMGGGDPFGGVWTPNKIYEGAAWRAMAGC
ncbi:MAG: pilin [Nitrospinae bacterium]|nr:pilin [Nitrospinota bacterium]